jgi:putative DNA primase/helicase
VDRPGDTLAASVTWAQILTPHAWTSAGSRGAVGFWRRPGKAAGTISATTNALGTNRFHVFSSNAAPFDPDTSYSKFAALAMLEHGGDFAAAARALRREVAPV